MAIDFQPIDEIDFQSDAIDFIPDSNVDPSDVSATAAYESEPVATSDWLNLNVSPLASPPTANSTRLTRGDRPSGTAMDLEYQMERTMADDPIWQFNHSAVGRFFGFPQAAEQSQTTMDALSTAVGRTGYLVGKMVEGATLRSSELLIPDLAEKIHSALAGYELAPDAKTVGEMTQFAAGLHTAGLLMKPLIGLMPAKDALIINRGGGLTFMLRNLSDQTVSAINDGKKFSPEQLLVETAIGVAFDAISVGSDKFARWWERSSITKPGTPESGLWSRVNKRVYYRSKEAFDAAARNPKKYVDFSSGKARPSAAWDKEFGVVKDELEIALNAAFRDTLRFGTPAEAQYAKEFHSAMTSMSAGSTTAGSTATDIVIRSPQAAAASQLPKQLTYGDAASISKAVDRAFVDRDTATIESIANWLNGQPEIAKQLTKEGVYAGDHIGTVGEETLKTQVDHIKYILDRPDMRAQVDSALSVERKMLQPTQLATRQETPGELRGPAQQRVLLTEPPMTGIEISGKRAWYSSYSATRAADLGYDVIPSDPAMAKRRAEVLKSMANDQERYMNKRSRAIRRGDVSKQNYFNPWTSMRHSIMSFEENTGIPVYHIADDMFRKTGTAQQVGFDLVNSSVRLSELAGLTPQDNKYIAMWLFSPETRAAVESKMSTDAASVAARMEDILQGEAANDIRERSFSLWDKYGIKPADVKQYGKPKDILADGRKAKAAGKLKDWIATQKWGTRKFYYMSDPMKQDMIDDYLANMGKGALHAPVKESDLPGSFPYEVRARKGKSPIKEGSVVNNILTHVQRIKIANAIADDLDLLYDRLNSVTLSSEDRQSLTNMINNLMMRRQPVGGIFKLGAAFRRMYWRPTMSYLWRPSTALYRALRNSLQNFAYGPYATNTTQCAKELAKMSIAKLQGKTLEQYDPEMMNRYGREFTTYVSQRQAYYREFLLQDTANITKDYSKRATARKAIRLMETTGGLYGLVDEWVNRFPLWCSQYQVTKSAATEYLAGKIDDGEFYRRTRLDTVRKPQQLLVHDLLSAGKVDELAMQSANWATEDVNFKYKTHERALAEQTMQQRTLMGLYTFPRGTVELAYNRGVRPMLQGVETGNYEQAYHGAANLFKGLMSTAVISTVMGAVLGKQAYNAYNTVSYNMLDPGTGNVYSLLEYQNQQMYRLATKQQTLLQTIDNVAESWAKVGETLFIPLSVEITNWYESNNDKAGVNLYRLVRNGVAAKLGYKERDFARVSRTQKQAFVHALLGSYEYPVEEGKLVAPPPPSAPTPPK